MKNYLITFSIILFAFSCAPRKLSKAYSEEKVRKIYNQGIDNTAKPTADDISRTLIPITKTTPKLIWKNMNGEDYLLVSSWKTDTTYYKNDEKTGFYNTGNYPIWVTIAPVLQQKCQDPKFGKREGLDLRLKQMLGLPPSTKQKYFIEFWVKPSDLFRPCPDNQITDGFCDLCFPENTLEEYKIWINNLRVSSYFNCNWFDNYPWTQLGYTYDWNKRNRSHVGMSEFVIDKNKNIIVKGFYKTADYCQPKK